MVSFTILPLHRYILTIITVIGSIPQLPVIGLTITSFLLWP
jgi:hypothetical protein